MNAFYVLSDMSFSISASRSFSFFGEGFRTFRTHSPCLSSLEFALSARTFFASPSSHKQDTRFSQLKQYTHNHIYSNMLLYSAGIGLLLLASSSGTLEHPTKVALSRLARRQMQSTTATAQQKMYSMYFLQWFAQGGAEDVWTTGGCADPQTAPTLTCDGEGHIEIIQFHLNDHNCAAPDDKPGELTCMGQDHGAIVVVCKGYSEEDLGLSVNLPSLPMECHKKKGNDKTLGSAKQWAYLYTNCNEDFTVRSDVTCAGEWGSTGERYCYSSANCKGGPKILGRAEDTSCSLTLSELTLSSKHLGDETCIYAPPEESFCGDGQCDANENHELCADDCPGFCGDKICSSGETASTCPDDCPPEVKKTSAVEDAEKDDILVEVKEDAQNEDENEEEEDSSRKDENSSINIDEESATPSGTNTETNDNNSEELDASQDKTRKDTAQDNTGKATTDNTDENTKEVQGDVDAAQENKESDPQDTPPVDLLHECGNGICEIFESNTNCAQDCPPSCGDGICSKEESVASCPQDCAKVFACPRSGCPGEGQGLQLDGGNVPFSVTFYKTGGNVLVSVAAVMSSVLFILMA